MYIALYLRGIGAVNRYAAGFVIDECPVCQRGMLHVEARSNRVFGIPRARRTVRCDECRSVLREIGERRWRYAIDGFENLAMFELLNGQEVSDSNLVSLVDRPIRADSPVTPRPPTFTDDSEI